MTEYTLRLTIAVPESMMEAANHLAVSIGESAGDFESFVSADWQDAEGNKYAVMSSAITGLLLHYAGTQLQRRDFAPESWSLELAMQAQAAINLWLGDGDPPTASPDRIAAIVMDDAWTALQLLGVSRIPVEGEE